MAVIWLAMEYSWGSVDILTYGQLSLAYSRRSGIQSNLTSGLEWTLAANREKPGGQFDADFRSTRDIKEGRLRLVSDRTSRKLRAGES